MSEKLAIVTGTSSGIGAALAESLLDRGWHVFGVARREAAFPGGRYQHVQADLADPAVIAGLRPRIEAEMAFGDFSRLALVNNAATPGQLRSHGDLDAAKLYRNLAVNLSAPLALQDLAVRLRPGDAALRVVNISSGLAYRPLPGGVEYCASKAGLHLAGEVLASEDHANTAVFNYQPGIVDTEMQETLRGESEDFESVDVFRAMHDEGRLAAAADVLDPILAFLEADGLEGFHEDRYEPPGG
jgi:benzil reductase ((S)-benzoin forming)